MGVADITNTWGWRPCPLGRQGGPLAHPEAVLLVGDHQAQAGKSTPSLSRAWVPTSRVGLPRRQAFPAGPLLGGGHGPGEQVHHQAEPASRPSKVLACCWASSSVGAMRAVWAVLPGQLQAQTAATTVLPEPTSPGAGGSWGVGWREVGPASSTSPALGPGGEGQPGGEGPQVLPGGRGPPAAPAAAPDAGEPQVQAEELLKHQPPGPGQGLPVRGKWMSR